MEPENTNGSSGSRPAATGGDIPAQRATPTDAVVPPGVEPPKVCPECGKAVQYKPAGTNQRGAYSEFWSCSGWRETGCNFSWRPPKETQLPLEAPEQMSAEQLDAVKTLHGQGVWLPTETNAALAKVIEKGGQKGIVQRIIDGATKQLQEAKAVPEGENESDQVNESDIPF